MLMRKLETGGSNFILYSVQCSGLSPVRYLEKRAILKFMFKIMVGF